MQERIKLLREELGLSQGTFADRIGVKQGVVSRYERGLNVPSKAVVMNICKAYHVSEKWLLTGEGEMFETEGEDLELAAFFGTILSKKGPEFQKRFQLALSRMPEELWGALEQIVDYMLAQQEQQKKSRDDPDSGSDD